MNQITLSIDIESLEILFQSFDTKGNIIIEVKSTKDSTTCHKNTAKEIALIETIILLT